MPLLLSNHAKLLLIYDNSMPAEFQNNVLSTFNVFPQLSPDGRLSVAGACLDSVFIRCLATLRLAGHGGREEPERH